MQLIEPACHSKFRQLSPPRICMIHSNGGRQSEAQGTSGQARLPQLISDRLINWEFNKPHS
jgi:hypothetical protein